MRDLDMELKFMSGRIQKISEIKLNVFENRLQDMLDNYSFYAEEYIKEMWEELNSRPTPDDILGKIVAELKEEIMEIVCQGFDKVDFLEIIKG